ncbi:MAG: type I restriction enzyme HsdR N-terminal domain-containing protein [Bacteroidota bacterium]
MPAHTLHIDFLRFRDRLQTSRRAGKAHLWDPIRQKHLVLQPEELVRQLVLHYLIEERGYNRNRISIEKGLKVNDLQKRCDILVYRPDLTPLLLVECKAPEVPLSQAAFEQIARYNLPLRVDYLLVTNGIHSYCCAMNYATESYAFLDTIPHYPPTASEPKL